MIFYDFEVFRYDWLVVLIDLNARKETVIINDPDKLKRFYEQNKGVIGPVTIPGTMISTS